MAGKYDLSILFLSYHLFFNLLLVFSSYTFMLFFYHILYNFNYLPFNSLSYMLYGTLIQFLNIYLYM